ncbi:MAG: DUF5668 domain-containing protein [Anaerolineales bacterium]|jgi:hypothetical protein
MNEQEPRRFRGSVFGPIILITIGVIFLLNNLGVLEGDIWSLLLLFWPVILIAIGLDSILKREGLVGAVFLIGLGIVFLLSNLGYLNVNVWQMVLNLWPILLIAIGFDLVIGRRSIWASLVGLVLVLGILVGSLWLFGVRVERGQALSGEQINQPLGQASRARISISPGAGNLELNALQDSSDALISGTVAIGRGQTPMVDYSNQGGVSVYSLRNSASNFFFPGDNRWLWELGLTTQVPIDLKVDLGAGSAQVDLSQLDLSQLAVDLGVGRVVVQLPEEGDFSARIDGAIGQIVVEVPSGQALRVRADTGIANISVPNNFQKQDGVYTSPNYAGAENQIDLSVDQAIGNITIQYAR